MRTQIQHVLLLLFAFTFLAYIFALISVEAAKLESGATIRKSPPLELTCVDNNGDGVDDYTGKACGLTAGQPGETACGLEIVTGVPIKYGVLNPGQLSTEQTVVIKDIGITGTLKIKGSDWISNVEGNPTISGPEITHFDYKPNTEYSQKRVLTSSGFDLGIPGHGQLTPLYFQFKVPINGTIGDIHQDITMDLLC